VTVNRYLDARGIRITTGTIVDATIIHARSSTNNSSRERDPDMHQTRKGNQWYFGARVHICMDSKGKVVHSVATSAASVADAHMLSDLLHGEEKKVLGDGAYHGQAKCNPPGCARGAGYDQPADQIQELCRRGSQAQEHTSARVRSKVEHPFRILKRTFGFTKVLYLGISKNHQWLCAAFALVNLYQHRNRLVLQRACVS
jgi:IS5 family transposase